MFKPRPPLDRIVPKAEMNAFDVAALVHELRGLLGARLDKVFQPERDEILLRFRVKATDEGSKRDVAVIVGKAVTMTKMPRDNPTEPSSFAMQLRRQLAGARLDAVRQHHFDRVVEMDLVRGEDLMTLVVELFHDGNVILVKRPPAETVRAAGAGEREGRVEGRGEGSAGEGGGGEGKIVAALMQQSWATREVRPGADFKHPPPRTRPGGVDYGAFRERVLASSSDAVRTLATEFNLGGQYAEEVCTRASVPKNARTSDLLEGQIRGLYDGLQGLVLRMDRGEFEPVIVWDGEKRVDVAPWPLAEHARFRVESTTSFAEALDQYYSKPVTSEKIDPALKAWKEQRAKVERQAKAQRDALERFAVEEKEARERGDLLYAHFQPAQAAIAYVSALGKSLGWKDGLARLVEARKESRAEALLVDNVLPKEAAATLILADAGGKMRKVRVDFREDLQTNAQIYYDKAKKFRDKQIGARTALKNTEAKLKELDAKGTKIVAAAEKKKSAAKPTKRFWFESYRWFRTEDGFLVLGGRDAATNEKLVKKHLEESDRYVHADIHGAPSCVIKSDGRDISEKATDEACAFAVGMSKTWTAGHAAGEAYWVTPSQVSKTPNPGEYVARGAFIIRGKRNYRTVKVRFAVGEVEIEATRKVMAGPAEAVLAQAKRAVVLEPGDEPANALAPRLAKAFDVPVEEIQAVLPPGGSNVVEVRGLEL